MVKNIENNIVYNNLVHVMETILSELAEVFANELETVRTIDGYLVKLDSVVYKLRELCSEDKDCVKEYLTVVLNNGRVKNQMRALACHVEDAISLISSSPRFRGLRIYVDELRNYLATIECNEGKPLRVTREPVFRIEYAEHQDKIQIGETLIPTIYNDVFTSSKERYPERNEFKSEEYSEHSTVYREPIEKPVSIPFEEERRRSWKKYLAISLIIMLITGSYLYIYYRNYTGDYTRYIGLETTKFSINLGNTRLTIDNSAGVLRVEYNGRWLPYLWIDTENETIHLTPYLVNSTNAIVARYVLVNSTYSTAEYLLNDIKKLLFKIGDLGDMELIVEPESKVCYMDYSDSEGFSFSYCEDVILLPSISLYGKTLYDVLVDEVNISVVNYLKKHFISKLNPKSPSDLMEKILLWLSVNAEYNYFKAAFTPFSDIENPIEFLNTRTGICADYAVFTSTALLAGGFKESYILVFNTTRGGHATAAAILKGTLYILDQRPPMYTWKTYVSKVFSPIGEYMQVIKISLDKNGYSNIMVKTVSVKGFPRNYLKSQPTASLALHGQKYIVKKLYSSNVITFHMTYDIVLSDVKFDTYGVKLSFNLDLECFVSHHIFL